uniref:sciellin n=1 Tax=Euleptes europaea TaxID=460621 RepID=UPI002541534A|nr:sciellin [Euleptes europaea]
MTSVRNPQVKESVNKMSTFNVAQSSPNQRDAKNASLAMKSRQQVLNEVNKRGRTLLQDNSWIKKRPEEENVEENYGKVVLNQYKSQDSLHRNADEKDEQKALLSRYRSDTTLNRISDRNNDDKANTLPTLASRPNNGKELVVPGTTGIAASPVKKKRQSWMPPPVPGQKPTFDNTEPHKRVASPSDKTGGPKKMVHTSEPMTPPKPNHVVNDQLRTRQMCPAKPSKADADRNTTTERTRRSQDLDSLIQVKAAADKSERGNLDDLIKEKPSSNGHNKGDLDDLIQGKPASNQRNKGTVDELIKVNPAANGNNKGGKDLDDLIDVSNTAPQNRRSQDLDDLIVIKSSTVDQNKKWISEHECESANAPDKQSDTNYSYQVTRISSCNASSSCSHPKDTVVYTRTYENSTFPRDPYEKIIHGKSIKTVYSTSDRAVIENEMCTYCRKALGIETKMILDALQICCHATCFKCEVCKGPLENLKAGDSIWIHKNTVHCEPCYSKVKASWIY